MVNPLLSFPYKIVELVLLINQIAHSYFKNSLELRTFNRFLQFQEQLKILEYSDSHYIPF